MRLFFTTLLLVLSGSALQAQHQMRYLDATYNPFGLSPDGKYICGQDNSMYDDGEGQGFIINTETLTAENLSTGQSTYDISTAYGINNLKMVAGSYRDHTFLTRRGIPVTRAGIYKEGKWIGLDGLETLDYRNFDDPQYEGSRALAISGNGNVAVGCLITNSIQEPCAWIYNKETEKYEYTPYGLPPGATMGAINSVSADGSIACGFYIEDSNRRPIYWTSPDNYFIIPDILLGEANAISSDGKTIALEVSLSESLKNMSGLYNIEEKTLMTTVGVEGEGRSFFEDLSTNRYAVGSIFVHVTLKKALIYSDQIGAMPFYNFLALIAPDILINLNDEIGFSLDNDFLSDLRAISDDGKTMIGVGGDAKPFIFTIDENYMPTFYNRPTNLNGETEGRNKITLTWNAPEEQDGAVLSGYNIYKFDVLADRVSKDQLSYTFEENLAGDIRYSVTAVYGEGQSFRSEAITLHIVATYDLPLIEDFDYSNLSLNSWEITNSDGNAAYWYNSDSRGGIDGFTATLFINGIEEEYSSSLTSRILDATNTQTVYLSYLYSYGKTMQNKDAVPDTLRVELYNGSNWITIKEYLAKDQYQEWTLENIDVSDKIANTMARLRFRGTGKNFNPVMWDIDNVRVTANKDLDVNTPPLDTYAAGGENRVIIAWRNPDGVYDLTYAQTAYPNAQSSAGNGGKPFIAVNYYYGYELERLYKGEYLTAISACLRDLIGDKSVITELALAVYLDNERVVNQPIYYFEGEAWNTFQLDKPVLIDGTKDLKFGIEVVRHDARETPIGLDHSNTPIKGKGDLYSEDGGVTWKNISDEVMQDDPTYFQANWYIIGHLTKTDSEEVEPVKDSPIAGYTVYRKGEKLNQEMVYATSYTANNQPTAIGDCFTVSAYYYDGTQSVLSEEFCLTTLGIENSETSAVVVYPNPASDYIYVDGEFTQLILINVNGQFILESKQRFMDVNHLQEGIYFLKIKNKEEVIVEKIVIKK